jgi:peptidoglycan hydrolase-like protein with peptidoglycan-binding domain
MDDQVGPLQAADNVPTGVAEPTLENTPLGAAPPTATAPPGSDGSRRRKTALAVVGTAVVAGLLGGVIGNRIQSPADRAAASAAPIPSLITVPVERRSLSSELVLSGSVNYNEPTFVQLAGGVGIDKGEAAVVTDIRQTGEELQEGDVLLEVTGRPVLVLQGDVPMYRRLVIGSEGPDVAQLELALQRLGYNTGTVDTVFDTATAAAVEEMYADAGYTAEGPSVDEREALTSAQNAVRQAEENLAAANKAVEDARRPMLESERLQLERSLQSARDAVPAAREAANESVAQADQAVATAQAARNTAVVARDTAANMRDLAAAGTIDPDTGEPYTAERTAQLAVEAAAAQEALVAADAQVDAARISRDRAADDGERSIADAEFQLRLTEAQYAEQTASGDTTVLDKAVEDAQQSVTDATANLTALQAATGLRISPGEIIFVPLMPTTLTESYVTLGSPVQGQLGTLATSSTLVTGRVSRVDSALVAVGASVTIDIRGSGVTTTGTVLSVGSAPAQQQGGENGGFGPSGGNDTSGRLVVTIAPDDPDVVANYVFWDARIVISVASSGRRPPTPNRRSPRSSRSRSG